MTEQKESETVWSMHKAETMSQTTVTEHLPDAAPDKENMTSQLVSEYSTIRLDYTNCTMHPESSIYSTGFSTNQLLYVVV
jgi:hypothetical protein